jgi:hypothetical protein
MVSGEPKHRTPAAVRFRSTRGVGKFVVGPFGACNYPGDEKLFINHRLVMPVCSTVVLDL